MVFENFNLEQCEDSKSIGNLTIAINLVTACIEAHLLRSSRQEKGLENFTFSVSDKVARPRTK